MPLVNMLLGEVIFGGLGTGLYSIILAALIGLFVGGLMVGRTPEYLGKQIGPTEMKLISLRAGGWLPYTLHINFRTYESNYPHGFSMWLAGGGVKGGQVIGSTDPVGLRAAEDRTHVHDIHATILYLFGIEHTKLTYRYSGRDFRLTDVSGEVLHDLIA